MRGVLPALAVLSVALIGSAPLAAQNPGADPIYGSVSLDGGFMPDPYTVSLTAGGSVDVNIGGCTYGEVANAPDVDLYYSASGGQTLYIYVEADRDATLLVNTPDGSWTCNDDGHTGVNPLIVIPNASSGLYNIWVGTYGSDNFSAELFISEIDPSGSSYSSSGSSSSGRPSISADPTYGSVSLDGGFMPDPYTVSLTAGGSLDVDVGGCTYGQVANAPDVDLYYSDGGGRTLYIYAESSRDITLLVNLPSASWVCDDDGGPGTNPLLIVPNAPEGLYNIWVGTYGSDMTSSTLYISEIDPRKGGK